MIIDPVRKFEVAGQVCPLLAKPFISTVATNQSVIAAVSGKRIRVMGWIAQSSGAGLSTFIFESASGGSALTAPISAPPNTNGDTHDLPIVDSGYFETNTGEGLFVDVATTLLHITVFYITYTPS